MLDPMDHLDRARSCRNLADALWKCFKQTQDMALIDETIALERQVYDLQRSKDHPGKLSSRINLVISLMAHHQQNGNLASHDGAVNLYRQVIELWLVGYRDRDKPCHNLACSLAEHFEWTGERVALDEAIGFAREAVALHPSGHPDRSDSCNTLAILLSQCWELTADKALLDEAIGLDREALSLRPIGHLDHGQSCANLAIHLKELLSEMWGAYTIGPSRTFGTGAEPCKRWDRQTTILLTIYWYMHSLDAMVMSQIITCIT
jgi:hypothetical protein